MLPHARKRGVPGQAPPRAGPHEAPRHAAGRSCPAASPNTLPHDSHGPGAHIDLLGESPMLDSLMPVPPLPLLEEYAALRSCYRATLAAAGTEGDDPVDDALQALCQFSARHPQLQSA